MCDDLTVAVTDQSSEGRLVISYNLYVLGSTTAEIHVVVYVVNDGTVRFPGI